jgi:PHP family Zn ribbon phosphoesterase
MRFVADFHLHSKYARATSPRCDPDGLSIGSKIKGIDIIATGDYTHPVYFEEL